ncbi:cytidine deaminase [Vibrio maerlii]|uniref:cytidine deaminase n=1 Tax=Vibrio maerlii TaxID=2231648 RepID=UPI000E3B9878|nr:cytidine deaminase [Vibrio maerlii]
MQATLQDALASFPSEVAQYLTDIMSRDTFSASISAEEFAHLRKLSGLDDNELRVALLPLAATFSHAPISNFYVGAIARGLSGNLYFGANMEFSGTQLGQTVHAEQSAISHAWMKGETGLKDITINFSPCGHCRQFMNEISTAETLNIQLPERDEKTLHEYLPEAFGPSDLGITTPLMHTVDHNVASQSNDKLIAEAVSALNKSHAPYTKNFSGVAIQTKSGALYLGSYAENAAFNPSLPPLQVALIQLTLNNEALEDIAAVALAEMTDATISHLADTQATIESINPDIPVSYASL